MPRLPSSQPSEVELSILRVLWTGGPRTVRQVAMPCASPANVGYTSTLKMMQVMHEKGLLKRDDSQRPQLYRTALPQDKVQNRIVRDVIDKVFGGSARKLVLHAVQSQHISADELAEIRKILDGLDGGKP